jgi:CRP/FNR family cyclic AMP-dependent transcriptional regulator
MNAGSPPLAFVPARPPHADPFAPLAAETLRAMASSGVVRRFAKNTVLINEGDRGDSIYIVLAGKVKVFASNEAGKEVVIDFHGPGEYVGEMSLDGAPRSASVMTIEPTACAVVSPPHTLPTVWPALGSTRMDRSSSVT